MASGRGWRPRTADASWRAAAPRAGHVCPPEAGPPGVGRRSSVQRLRRRSEFLRVAGARRKWAAPGLVLQALRRPADGAGDSTEPRYGLTASRKVGGAVVRNRARRRLRAAAEMVIPAHVTDGYDLVLIARKTTVTRSFAGLLEDLETALKRVGAWREGC